MRQNHTPVQRERRTQPGELDDLAGELEAWLEREFGSAAPQQSRVDGAMHRLVAGLVLAVALWVGFGVAIAWLLS